MQMKHC